MKLFFVRLKPCVYFIRTTKYNECLFNFSLWMDKMASEQQIEYIKGFGNFVMIIGVGGMAVMSLVGYIALIVIASQGNSTSHGHNNGDGFASGFLFAWLLTSNGCYRDHYSNLVSLIAFSLMVSVLTIALSFAYGYGMIGIGLAVGWGASFALMALGAAIYSAGESLTVDNRRYYNDDHVDVNAGPARVYTSRYVHFQTEPDDRYIPVVVGVPVGSNYNRANASYG